MLTYGLHARANTQRSVKAAKEQFPGVHETLIYRWINQEEELRNFSWHRGQLQMHKGGFRIDFPFKTGRSLRTVDRTKREVHAHFRRALAILQRLSREGLPSRQHDVASECCCFVLFSLNRTRFRFKRQNLTTQSLRCPAAPKHHWFNDSYPSKNTMFVTSTSSI